jgi:hypothetical protein
VVLHVEGQADMVSLATFETQKYPHGMKLLQGTSYELLMFAPTAEEQVRWMHILQVSCPDLIVERGFGGARGGARGGAGGTAGAEGGAARARCRLVNHQGWLTKRGQIVQSKKRRWFKLHDCFLQYYTDETCSVRKGCVGLDLVEAKLRCVDMRSTGHRFSFELSFAHVGFTLNLYADSQAERAVWMTKLEAAIPQLVCSSLQQMRRLSVSILKDMGDGGAEGTCTYSTCTYSTCTSRCTPRTVWERKVPPPSFLLHHPLPPSCLH